MTNKIQNSKLKLQTFRFCFILLFILAVIGLPVNSVFAVENPFGNEADNQPDLRQIQFIDSNVQPVVQPASDLAPEQNEVQVDGSNSANVIVLNPDAYKITAAEAKAGKKFKVFDNKFIFQIDKNTFSDKATLDLTEMILTPGSKMSPPLGFQMASKIYEYNLKTEPGVKFNEPFWFSIKYDSSDYFRKNLYYYDELKAEWVGLPSLIKNGESKIVSNFSLPYAKVAILEDISIMTEGTASWYKYKGCNCAASPDYPKGTKLKVTNIDNGKSVIVKVNDWGPDRSVHPTRVIDLDVVAFKQIAKKSAGLCKVKVEPAVK
ncbi:MAG: septal ring lytic transglycosylase RlpA family protein [Patescibacteria group bacterium]